ncbi:MAG: hypothetical protein JWN92_2446 [Candidatus Acidoferrum typicum]|nr:hypothetical protein [Candidatus Acidoferrum typicum]
MGYVVSSLGTLDKIGFVRTHTLGGSSRCKPPRRMRLPLGGSRSVLGNSADRHKPYCLSGAERYAASLFELKWIYAKEDLLDHVVSIGFDRRSRVAILVGNGSVYSAGCFKLVGCVSQRLVLAETCKKVLTSFRGASRRRGIPFRLNLSSGEIPHFVRFTVNVHREWNDDRSTVSANYFVARFAPLTPFTLN